MDKYFLEQEKRLCEKYNVSSIDAVLEIQRDSFRKLYEMTSTKKTHYQNVKIYYPKT